MSVFDDRCLDERRARAARAFGDDAPVILIAAGEPIPRPGGLDQTYPFVPHPEYYWLSGSRRPGGVLAYDMTSGWTHFVRPVTEKERLWSADIEGPAGTNVETLLAWLIERNSKPIVVLGASLEGVESNKALAAEVRRKLDAVRRVKDAAELALLEKALSATAAGYARLRQLIRPGVSERALQIEFEAEIFRHGADDVGYGTIVAAGARAAILHAEPGPTTVKPDDVVLIDAAGQVAGYTVDVTRTYPAGARFTAQQQAIYDLVKAAQTAAIAGCRAGVEWFDVHRIAATELAAGLRELGLLRCSVDVALDNESIALFFPHGIGHMVGLGVRDVGGALHDSGNEGRICCGARLRVDLPLRPGFLMTVEPGLYFAPAILDDPQRRKKFARDVDWDCVDRWRAVGGVRIEDNVLVGEAQPDVITKVIPK